jgi:hypothetical protein
MAAPPEYYKQARDAATHHVQMLIEEAVFETAGGYTRVRGPVLKVFRGPESMMGTPIVLDLTTYRDSSEIRPGSPAGYMVGRITAGKILEAYLDQSPAGFDVSMAGTTLLTQATEVSQIEILSRPVFLPPERIKYFSVRRLMYAILVVAVIVIAIVYNL